MAVLEFNFDFVSPMSYFALVQLDDLRARTSCKINFVPVFLGGVMQATGNTPPPTVKAKRLYMMKDMARLAHKLKVPYAFNPHFPMNTLPLLRMAAGIPDMAERENFVKAIFPQIWVEQKNPADSAVCDAVLMQAGYDPDKMNALATDPANKEAIVQNSESAVARGAFGAPTFFVGDEMYFGQDRLHLVEDALKGTVWA